MVQSVAPFCWGVSALRQMQEILLSLRSHDKINFAEYGHIGTSNKIPTGGCLLPFRVPHVSGPPGARLNYPVHRRICPFQATRPLTAVFKLRAHGVGTVGRLTAKSSMVKCGCDSPSRIHLPLIYRGVVLSRLITRGCGAC